MPKASQRLPLLQTLSSLQFIDALNSDSDSDLQEDMITSQGYSNPCRKYPSHYMTTHESFEKLVAQIQDYKTFKNSSQNKEFNPAIQLAVALSSLGSNGNGATLGKIGMLFGISHGSIVLYTQRVIHILMKLKRKVILWPTIEQQREISQVMKAEGFSGCIGFIDWSLIPLSQCPPNDGEAYFYCKKRYFMSIQLVCNINKQFTALHVGFTGSLHDPNVYQHIKIAQTPQEVYEKYQYLLSDSEYASSPWVVPAYKIKHAVRILKRYWFSPREIQNQMRDNHEMEYFVSWVVPCTILHNMLAQIGDEWFDLYDDDDPPHVENLANNNIGEDVVNMHEKIEPITLAWKNSQLQISSGPFIYVLNLMAYNGVEMLLVK
ncbi:hypothetical protein O181_121818 [Austropuccinia psidii MF-1]|uniref:DDE Tnp4 domain-containing protein n=1 Tax=Austropuccinia psidii MF-1 TaxID=1389203 RepID=A0A9Q3KI87_9BASI|nr:hypothetical protein [Austropuccinia psidii MF-1]